MMFTAVSHTASRTSANTDLLQLRRDAIEHVHLSCSESPTVADSRSASQWYDIPSDSLQLASCSLPRVASLGVG